MNPREKLLAGLVGLLVALFALKYVGDRVLGAFEQRNDRIASLEQEIRGKKRIVMLGQRAARQMTELEGRSLPPNLDLAGSQYRAWLLELLNHARWSDGTVKGSEPRPVGDVFHQFSFTVAGRGNLEQLVRFLHEFYSVDHLHRIKNLVVKPLTDSNELDLALTIEAVSLNTAPPNRKKLIATPAERLTYDGVQPYIDAIVGRNIFSPANTPPRFASFTPPPIYRGQAASFRIPASDPDQDQQLTWSLDGNPESAVQIEPKTGELRITPEATGELQFDVVVTDNGMPARAERTTVKLAVTEPPAEQPQPAALDASKFAFVTGITEINGRPQVWITLRTEGKVLRLFEGDRVEVGSVAGVVTRIDNRRIEIEVDDERRVVAIGESLSS